MCTIVFKKVRKFILDLFQSNCVERSSTFISLTNIYGTKKNYNLNLWETDDIHHFNSHCENHLIHNFALLSIVDYFSLHFTFFPPPPKKKKKLSSALTHHHHFQPLSSTSAIQHLSSWYRNFSFTDRHQENAASLPERTCTWTWSWKRGEEKRLATYLADRGRVTSRSGVAQESRGLTSRPIKMWGEGRGGFGESDSRPVEAERRED